mmetsp:Transcript_17926/g.23455  ORF Transcript_17926/g.23455 Transcript_17926/m.23455 type:complete len:109 (-) Transcript_17926:429-755(-)
MKLSKVNVAARRLAMAAITSRFILASTLEAKPLAQSQSLFDPDEKERDSPVRESEILALIVVEKIHIELHEWLDEICPVLQVFQSGYWSTKKLFHLVNTASKLFRRNE